jgi:two-component system, chemotaxis family, sensor kinase CheA
MLQDQEILNEFIIETNENLVRLSQDLVAIETRPQDADLLASIFRTFHTIKGTAGFLGFQKLEELTHTAENVLSQVRNGELAFTQELVSLILDATDAVTAHLTCIEASGQEAAEEYEDLQEHLRRFAERPGAGTASPAPPQAAPSGTVEPGPGPSEAGGMEASGAGRPAGFPPEAAEPRPNAAAEGEGSPALKGPPLADSTIRVDVGLLDKLMNLVGELVLSRNQILQYSLRHSDAALTASSQHLNLITAALQEGVMKTRMQPIGTVWNKLPRVVRDMAKACHKQIRLEMDGAETELDRTIIEAIKDPVTHLLRNACDHGLETPEVRAVAGKPAEGKLAMRAFHEGGYVKIEICDDGAGIDPEKIKNRALARGLIRPDQAGRMDAQELVQLIFRAGFSTAEKVTNISGRGVGMDVVKTNVERIGGVVELTSVKGQGTTVHIKIPLTLAIIPGLIVLSSGRHYVIPQVNLQELVRLEGEATRNAIESAAGTPVLRRRGRLLPLVYMNEVLGLKSKTGGAEQGTVNIVVLQAEDRQFGLAVDTVLDTQEIVVKPLGRHLKKVDCFAGAAIMGDGGVALILDVARAGRKAGIVLERGEARARRDQEHQAGDEATQTYLLFRAAGLKRAAVPLAEVSRLEEFARSSIEFAAGRPVIQYRGEILPLLSLGQVLGHQSIETAFRKDPVLVIVFRAGDRPVGMAVDEIIDIAMDRVEMDRVEMDNFETGKAAGKGVLRSTRIDKRVTDLLNLKALLEACGSEVVPDLVQSLDALRAGVSRRWEELETAEVSQ